MRSKHPRITTPLFAICCLLFGTTEPGFGVDCTTLYLPGFGSSATGISGTQAVGYALDAGLAWSGVFVNRAWLWDGSTYVSLHPASGYQESGVYGISGTQQVGWGGVGPTVYAFYKTALLWNGTAQSCVKLHPDVFAESVAYATNGTQQVGYASYWDYENQQLQPRALLWNGSADSYVDLTPSGFTAAVAQGISGTRQVGYALGASHGSHALLWRGSANDYIDLHPVGFGWSRACSMSDAQQVGWGGIVSGPSELHHALLWNGSADSCIDLHPGGFNWSEANGTNGTQQVGEVRVTTGGLCHASLWNGSAASFVDLHQYLPAGFVRSGAKAIDEYGNIVGWAVDDFGYTFAILWQPVPEPTALFLLALGAVLATRKRMG